ncbi:MAG: DNA adenine methylase [Pseudomonadota bacterium]
MTKTNSLNPVQPATPPAAWIGGKRLLAKRICAIIDRTDHGIYAEPFVGMGGIFLRRKMQPRAEAINDASGEVVNLFRILQRHYPQFMETIRFQITSRREFERLAKVPPETLTDLERAARFLYLQRTAFGGKVKDQHFGTTVDLGARFNLNRLAGELDEVHARLAGVTIENLDWLAFVERYDRAETLFYLDPPYYGNEDDYGKNLFGRDQFEALADRLEAIKGKFLLSINRRAETETVFGRFKRKNVELTYSAGKGKAKPAKELIVSNF